MKYFLAFIASALIGNFALATDQNNNPDHVAKTFYTVLVAQQIRGLPDKKEMKVIDPFLSDELKQRIAAAWAEHEEFMKSAEAQQSKPPWTKEGNLFGSLWEGMHSFEIGQQTGDAEMLSYPVYLSYNEGEESARWIDVLVLENTQNGWKVHNIYLNGPWDFRAHGSLRDILPETSPSSQ